MSALIATGVVAVGPPPTGPQTLALFGCPGSGSVVAVARPGDQMLVTGRSADGSWLRVYVPGPASDGWVPASTVNLLADGSTLPAVGCSEVAAATGPPAPTAVPATIAPTAAATSAPTAAPTAKPTARPTATPAPTAAPTATPNPGPVLASLKASRATIYASRSGHCVGDPASLSISVTATDADGVGSVTLYWKPAGSSTYRSKAMAASGNLWKAALSTQASGDQLTAKGTVAYYVVARDADGAQTRLPATTKSFKVALCNHPPAVQGVDFGVGGNLYAGEGPCTSTLSVYATVTDPDFDSLSSVVVFYKPFGASTYRSYKLARDPGSTGFYTGQISTVNWPFYPGPSPESYTLSWYFVATDALGATDKYTPSFAPVEYPCNPIF
ncbi:MAG TPA: hypothetical protein VG034_07790 [Acidimicrobiia bacterium]|nr:hypothetical protein [Acidimicrobiia bacterium]